MKPCENIMKTLKPSKHYGNPIKTEHPLDESGTSLSGCGRPLDQLQELRMGVYEIREHLTLQKRACTQIKNLLKSYQNHIQIPITTLLKPSTLITTLLKPKQNTMQTLLQPY